METLTSRSLSLTTRKSGEDGFHDGWALGRQTATAHPSTGPVHGDGQLVESIVVVDRVRSEVPSDEGQPIILSTTPRRHPPEPTTTSAPTNEGDGRRRSSAP